MSSMDDIENKTSDTNTSKSTNNLYIVFIFITVIYLFIKYFVITSSLAYNAKGEGSGWHASLDHYAIPGGTTFIGIVYVLITLASQLSLMDGIVCKNTDVLSIGQSLAAWIFIFGTIYLIINHFRAGWKAPFSNSIGYEISTVLMNMMGSKVDYKHIIHSEPILTKENSKYHERLVDIVTNILKDSDESVRTFINGTTLEKFCETMNRNIELGIIKNPEITQERSGGARRGGMEGAKPGVGQRAVAAAKAVANSNEALLMKQYGSMQTAKAAERVKGAAASAAERANALKNNVNTSESGKLVASGLAKAAGKVKDTAQAGQYQAIDMAASARKAVHNKTMPDTSSNLKESAKAELAAETVAASPVPGSFAKEASERYSKIKTNSAAASSAPDDSAAADADASGSSGSVDIDNMNDTMIRNLFKVVAMKDLISEFIWLGMAGSLSILVSYTFMLQNPCKPYLNDLVGDIEIIETEEEEVDPFIEQTQREMQARTDERNDMLEKEEFSLLKDYSNIKKSFNTDYKKEEFWLGEQYKSSLELGEYNINMYTENNNIKKRINKQGIPFLTQKSN